MLLSNADGKSANKNAESGDKNSLKTLQEQNVEMRNKSSEQEMRLNRMIQIGSKRQQHQ